VTGMDDTLKLYRGDQLLTQIALGERPLELGSGSGCDITLDDPELAERHWLAMRRLGTVVAYDVSGGRGAKPQHLPLGTRVALGRDHCVVREQRESRPRSGLHRDTEALALERQSCRQLTVVVGTGTEARRLRIKERPVHVGRGPDNELVLPDRAASLRHCRLEPSLEGLLVRDLGSSNGTFVNGVRIDRVLAGSGAQIRVGRTQLHVIEHDADGVVEGSGLVAASPAMLSVLAQAERAASLPWPALVLGESGCGKEGVAALLHARGPRRGKPLVTLNAGGVPHELVESELFGHERGAFTGATNARRGVFEQADGGTLFLDEIGELPLPLQARLLRVLECGEVRRVGAESTRRVDVRVVCATHRDLRTLTAEGGFREDLYFRLARVVIEIPPLRARPEDIDALCHHFLRELEPMVGRRTLSKEAMTLLRSHPWPGNVRELRNVLCASAAANDAQTIEHAEIERVLVRLGGRSERHAQVTAEALREVVEQHRGNLSAAARALRMPRSTLRDRLALANAESP
jgi:DNA-binding NtrC family response regulator